MKSVSSRDTNLGIIVEAKQQYTKQLMNIMKPIIYEEIFDMYNRSIQTCEDPNDLLICFQNELKQVPKWNSDVIKEATQKILDICSYFNDLVTAVFLSNVRILTSVKLGSKKRQVKLVVPTNDNFVHKVYINVSRSIYNDPFTFSNKRYQGNVLRNMNDVYPLIETSIEDTIRDMLPIQSILESYLGDTMDDSDTESEDPIEDPVEDPNEDPNEIPSEDPSEDPIEEERPVDPTEEPFSGNDFFAKPAPEQIKDIPVGKQDLFTERSHEETGHSRRYSEDSQEGPQEEPKTRPPEATKRPQTFFDDVEDY